MKRFKRFSDNSQPQYFQPKDQWDLRGPWSFIWQTYFSIICRIAFSREIEPLSKKEVDFLQRAELYLLGNGNPDFVLNFKDKFYLLKNRVQFIFNCRDSQCFERQVLLFRRSHKTFLQAWKALPHERDYFGNIVKKPSLLDKVFKVYSFEPREPKERSRIGVGYRDKGSMRFPYLNGEPSWKELDFSKESHLTEKPIKYDLDYILLCYRHGEIPVEDGEDFVKFLIRRDEEFIMSLKG